MVNFILKKSGDNVFSELTSEFHEFMEYLNKIEFNDFDLCTVVLDSYTRFIIENRKNAEVLDRALVYLEAVVSDAYKKEEVKCTVFEGLYSSCSNTLDTVKHLFKSKTKVLFEEWTNKECKTMFGG